MTVRFLKEYRSRAWMCRFTPGTVVTLENPAVIDEVIAGGFAESVEETASAEAESDSTPVSEDN